ncbi:hypothetical protein C2857_000115 [Epichloe festucae Fl1]|uniref:Cell wall protein n=1 Tax=Epichloe festucae (strain Fl1) TaxID=877507 RepID=A0A7U3SMR4_EPIFF|nr:hypothetical protein C2857_000115 [Epichloe festucae Fl1]
MRVTTIFAFASLFATSISTNDIPALISHASAAASSREVQPVKQPEKRAMLLEARAVPLPTFCGKDKQLAVNLQKATTARITAERKGAAGKEQLERAANSEKDALKACLDASLSPQDKAVLGQLLSNLNKTIDEQLQKSPDESIFRPPSAGPRPNPREDLGVVGELADELVPGKSYRDLVRAITSNETVSALDWFKVMTDVIIETASFVPTPLAPALQAFKVGRALLKLKGATRVIRSVEKTAKKVTESNEFFKKISVNVTEKIEKSLGNVKSQAKQGSQKPVKVIDILQAADRIKVPKAEAEGKLNPQLIGDALSQASKLKDHGTGVADAVKSAIKGIQPGPAAKSAAIETKGKRAAPAPSSTGLVDDMNKIANLRDRNTPVSLELISDILPKLEAQLFAAAGQDPAQGEQKSPLENEEFIEAFAEKFQRGA